MNPQVAVVVVSYNTRDLLLECLASVLESTEDVSIELVVVDNASRDGSYETARDAYPQAVAIGNLTNVGFGAACNQGIKATSAPFILLLNSDAQLTAQAVQALCDCLEKNERSGAAGCRLINAAGVEVINTRNFLTPLNQAFEMTGIKLELRHLRRTHSPGSDRDFADCSVDWIDGACLMLRRAAVEQVGLFDERFFMYSEDEDLCFRLRKHGWLVCFTGAAVAMHHGAASAEPRRAEMLRHFYLSQMRFLSKHRSSRSVFVYAIAVETVLIFKCLFLWDGRRRRNARDQLIALREAYALRDWRW